MMNKKQRLKFPEGFLWGAATSAHQVEGNTKNNWTEWEKENAERLVGEAPKKWDKWQQKKFPEMFEKENYISGAACDHYHLFETDFDMAKELGMNAQRISLEWSRIEPEEGKFDEKEIEHYRKVILAMRERGMEPFVTIWHWTHPLWLEEMGGPTNKKFAQYFARYAKKMSDSFGDLVKFWITINEPTTVIACCYATGVWPPQIKNPLVALKVYKVLALSHNLAYDALHASNKKVEVGFANVLVFFETFNKLSILNRITVRITDYFSNKKFLNLTIGKNDFLTLQYYFHKKISTFGRVKNENKEVNDLGWEIYQEGMYHLLKFLGKYELPIYITENGLADAADNKREKLIKHGLFWVHKAIQEGVDVRGYFHWSLLDNFEWDKGFWPRFGLIEMDFETQTRAIRKSALEYAKICKSNELEIGG